MRIYYYTFVLINDYLKERNSLLYTLGGHAHTQRPDYIQQRTKGLTTDDLLSHLSIFDELIRNYNYGNAQTNSDLISSLNLDCNE